MSKYLRLALALWVALFVASWLGAARAQTAPAAAPLDDVLHDMQGAPWAAVEMTAREQAANNGPRFRSAPAQVPFHKSFEGTFTPQDAQTRLAIFSDDGCDVFIDGAKVHAQKDRAQNMTALGESLHKINLSLQPGRAYLVRIDFSNVIYLGQGDMDGVTLFAYTDEAAPNPTATPVVTATPSPTAIPEESWGKLRIFKDNNGELGEEIGSSAGSGAGNGDGLQPMSASTSVESGNATSVGGDIWLVFELHLTPNEWESGHYSARWFYEDLSPVARSTKKVPVSQMLELHEPDVSYFFGGNWHPLPPDNRDLLQEVVMKFRSLVNTRYLLNGPCKLSLQIPDRDENGDYHYENGNVLWKPFNELVFYAQTGPYTSRRYTKLLNCVQHLSIKNLELTSAQGADGNQDYVRHDPESEDLNLVSNSLTFSFEDGDHRAGDRYDWQLLFRETSEPVSSPPLVIAQGTAPVSNGRGKVTVEMPESLSVAFTDSTWCSRSTGSTQSTSQSITLMRV
jgi:hypothetical protein